MFAYEKELFALAFVVRKWRSQLLGQPFVIKIGQQRLKYLFGHKVGTLVQQRWITKLLGYDFMVENKKGLENKVANALSRKVSEGE